VVLEVAVARSLGAGGVADPLADERLVECRAVVDVVVRGRVLIEIDKELMDLGGVAGVGDVVGQRRAVDVRVARERADVELH